MHVLLIQVLVLSCTEQKSSRNNKQKLASKCRLYFQLRKEQGKLPLQGETFVVIATVAVEVICLLHLKLSLIHEGNSEVMPLSRLSVDPSVHCQVFVQTRVLLRVQEVRRRSAGQEPTQVWQLLGLHPRDLQGCSLFPVHASGAEAVQCQARVKVDHGLRLCAPWPVAEDPSPRVPLLQGDRASWPRGTRTLPGPGLREGNSRAEEQDSQVEEWHASAQRST